MKRIAIVILVSMLTGCITPERLESDYREASKYDERAQNARERLSTEEAKYYDAQAAQLRRHHGLLELVVGALVSSALQGDKQDSNPTWP